MAQAGRTCGEPPQAGRSIPPALRPGHARPRDGEQGTRPAAHRACTVAVGDATAGPPDRAPERDGGRRTSWSWFGSRMPRRSERSRPSRCPRIRGTAASGAAAIPPPRAARAPAAPRPPNGRRPGCGRRARATAARGGRDRSRAATAARRSTSPPCSRARGRASLPQWLRPRQDQPATAVGTAGGARSSLDDLQARESKHEAILGSARGRQGLGHSAARLAVAIPASGVHLCEARDLDRQHAA
jgi:hypothetical protein